MSAAEEFRKLAEKEYGMTPQTHPQLASSLAMAKRRHPTAVCGMIFNKNETHTFVYLMDEEHFEHLAAWSTGLSSLEARYFLYNGIIVECERRAFFNKLFAYYQK